MFVIDIKLIDDLLLEVIKGEKGIKKIILVDKTGLTISDVSKNNHYPVDIAGIGAIASAVFCASEEQGKSLNIGNLTLVSSEFDNGKIFAANTGDGVLCVVSDSTVNLGMIRFLIRKVAKQLRKLLEEFLAPIKPERPMSESETSLTAALNDLDE